MSFKLSGKSNVLNLLINTFSCPAQFSEDCPKIKPVSIKLQLQLDVPNYLYVVGLDYKNVVLPLKEDVSPFQDVLIRVKSSEENELALGFFFLVLKKLMEI